MTPYDSKTWKSFRDEVISLDGEACSICGRTQKDGVVLQVHHKQYIRGFKPWEYPLELCATLCRGCHAAEHGKIPPKFGWEHIGYDDLGDLTGTCECCGNSIRYVFLVQHEKWGAMEVGEICCDNLTSTQVASNIMESKRRFADRLKRFISSVRWSELPSGIHHIIQDKIRIAIIPHNEVFKLRINGKLGKSEYTSILNAKKSVFELIESGVIREFLEKQEAKRIAYYEKTRYD